MVHTQAKPSSLVRDNIKTIQALTQMPYFGDIPFLSQIAEDKNDFLNLLHQNLTQAWKQWAFDLIPSN